MGVGFVDLFELLGDHLPILGIHFRMSLDIGDFALGFDDRLKSSSGTSITTLPNI